MVSTLRGSVNNRQPVDTIPVVDVSELMRVNALIPRSGIGSDSQIARYPFSQATAHLVNHCMFILGCEVVFGTTPPMGHREPRGHEWKYRSDTSRQFRCWTAE